MTKRAKLAAGIGSAGAMCALLGFAAGGAWIAIGLWVAAACAVAAAAYASNRPSLLGKREGRLSGPRTALLLPYLVAFWIGCHVRRVQRRSPVYDEVWPGLFVGGRIGARHLPEGVELILDLAAEWWEPVALRSHPGYRDVPVLDGSYPPDEDAFLAIVEEVAAAAGAAYVHCEAGVGRAPTAAALVLIARGVVDDPRAAVALLRERRPAISLTRSDLRFLHRLAPRVSPAALPVPVRAKAHG